MKNSKASFETKLILKGESVASVDCTDPTSTEPTTISGGESTKDKDTICDVDPAAVLGTINVMTEGDIEYEQGCVEVKFSENNIG